MLIAAATTFLALQGGGGYVPPRPLREWALFLAAGAWAAAIVVYRIFDRPPSPSAAGTSHTTFTTRSSSPSRAR